MHEGAQHVDGHVQAVANGQNDEHQKDSGQTGTGHRTQQVKDLRHNACRQPQRQYTAIGEQVGGVADQIVQALQATA